jgi:hypothetical protein
LATVQNPLARGGHDHNEFGATFGATTVSTRLDVRSLRVGVEDWRAASVESRCRFEVGVQLCAEPPQIDPTVLVRDCNERRHFDAELVALGHQQVTVVSKKNQAKPPAAAIWFGRRRLREVANEFRALVGRKKRKTDLSRDKEAF